MKSILSYYYDSGWPKETTVWYEIIFRHLNGYNSANMPDIQTLYMSGINVLNVPGGSDSSDFNTMYIYYP